MINPDKLEHALKAVRLTIATWTKTAAAYKASHLDQRGINADLEDMRTRLLNLRWRESRLLKIMRNAKTAEIERENRAPASTIGSSPA